MDHEAQEVPAGPPLRRQRDVYSGFEFWLFLGMFLGAPMALGLVIGLYL